MTESRHALSRDLTITVPGRLRYWIAEAILDAAISHGANARLKRNKSPGQKRLNKLADELREFSNKLR